MAPPIHRAPPRCSAEGRLQGRENPRTWPKHSNVPSKSTDMKSTALRFKQCLTRGLVLKIVDEHDREVPSETVGKIITSGPHVMPGYWNKPEETAQALWNLHERRHLWPV